MLKTYLSNRKQYTYTHLILQFFFSCYKYGSSASIHYWTKSFLIYINEMYHSAPNLKHFEDDTTTMAVSRSEREVFITLNGRLTSLDQWLSINRLSLNIKKTKYRIIINNNTSSEYRIKIRQQKN